jgi:hypothetical protein
VDKNITDFLRKAGSKGGKKSALHPNRRKLNQEAAIARWRKNLPVPKAVNDNAVVKAKHKSNKLRAAVRDGRLKRPKDAICSKCGAPNAIKHHESYRKPLQITYLCRKCHAARHKEILLKKL